MNFEKSRAWHCQIISKAGLVDEKPESWQGPIADKNPASAAVKWAMKYWDARHGERIAVAARCGGEYYKVDMRLSVAAERVILTPVSTMAEAGHGDD